MRINKFIAQATGMSRRAADQAIAEGRVTLNGVKPSTGSNIGDNDKVMLDGQPVLAKTEMQTIMLNKPTGYVVSRDGQGSHTVYDLLPKELHHLKPVGRLDKASSGLLLLTNDGELAQTLTHPSHQKTKVYQIQLIIPLKDHDRQAIEQGVKLEDGISKLQLQGEGKNWTVTMNEGRNRQIRRTFAERGYTVASLHRTHFGNYVLGDLRSGSFTSY